MKRLFYIALAIVLMTAAGCKRKDRAERLYERYLNDSNRVEFITPSADTVVVEEEVEEEPVAESETEGIFSIPDTPEERGVNMNSNDEELEKIMSGTDVEKEAAKDKKSE
jgi:hypothetical protein